MTTQNFKQQQLAEILALTPVLPVVVIDDLAHAVPMAKALVAGGIRVIEITLRTPVALDAVRAIRREVEEAIVGVGTILDGAGLTNAYAAGARFAVSPGATPTLIQAAGASALPLLPGVATASEAMQLLEHGYHHLKFFPAMPSGGHAMLAALANPLPQLRFCPTGGIHPTNALDFLELSNVACVGGSWLTPKHKMDAGDWEDIKKLASKAAALHQKKSAPHITAKKALH